MFTLIFIVREDFEKKHNAFVAHNESMKEIQNLSQSTSTTSCQNYIVEEEVAKLSTKWDELKEKFNDIHAQVIDKKEAPVVDKNLANVDEEARGIYLEPLPNMEQKLDELESDSTKKSNLNEISTKMTIIKLKELIANFRSFDNLRQSSIAWTDTVQSKIDVAKRNTDLMTDEDTLLQDEQTLTKVLQVIFQEHAVLRLPR